ncbi:hypothetical protein HID58_084584, partial [Brassica napus]
DAAFGRGVRRSFLRQRNEQELTQNVDAAAAAGTCGNQTNSPIMVIALLHESELVLSEDLIEVMVDKAFMGADRKKDGKIEIDEWKDFVSMNPSLIKNMTLPYLKDIKGTFPSFVSSCEDEESESQNLYF